MRLAWRNLVHDRTRLAVTVAGIAFAVFLMTFQGSLLCGFLGASSAVIEAADADLWVTARGVPAFDFPAPLPERFDSMARRVPGILGVRRIVTGFAQWQRSDGSRQSVIVVGADAGVGARFPRPSPRDGADAVTIDASDAARLGVATMPASVEVEGRRATVAATTAGFGTFIGSPYVFTRYEAATRYLDTRPQTTTYLACRVAAGRDVRAVRQALASHLPEAQVWTTASFVRHARSHWMTQTGAGGAILTAALLGFVVGVVIVSQTTYATTMENLEEYATLRAMGAGWQQLCSVVVVQGVAGSLLGYLAGMLVSLPAVAAARAVIPWIQPTWWLPLVMLGASLSMGALASVSSVRTVLRVEPGRVFRA